MEPKILHKILKKIKVKQEFVFHEANKENNKSKNTHVFEPQLAK